MPLGILPTSPTFRRFLAGPWAAIALVGVVLAALLLVLVELRENAVTDARGNLSNLALVMGAQTKALLEPADLALLRVRDSVAAQNPQEFASFVRGPNLREKLVQVLAHVPQLDIIAALDTEGRIIGSSLSATSTGIDLSGRDYFQHFKSDDDSNLFIGLAEKNRTTGILEIFLARRLTGPDGAFRGVVAATIAIQRFEDIFRSIYLPREESFVLARRDGTLLLRHPDVSRRAGNTMPAGSPWYRLVADGGGFYSSPGYFDNVARLIAVHPMRDIPLVVNAGMPENAILGRWRTEALWIGAAAMLLLACGGYLVAITRRQFDNLTRSRESLRRQNRELKELSDDLFASKAELANLTRELDTTLETMDQGLIMVDAKGDVVQCNSRARELLELPADLVAIRPAFAEVLAYQWKVNASAHPNETTFEAFVQNRLADDRPFTRELVRPNGTVIELRSVPTAEGGFVRTYTDITARKRAEDKVSYLAQHDELTRLMNRAAFRDRLGRALATVDDLHGLAIMCLDLDHFKEVNDTYGHDAGDRVLEEAADRMRRCLRATDTLARLGGDEFAILLAGLPTELIVAEIARHLVKALGTPYAIDKGIAHIGVSIGIAFAPQDGREIDQLLQGADTALYQAKRAGRDTFRFYRPSEERSCARFATDVPA